MQTIKLHQDMSRHIATDSLRLFSTLFFVLTFAIGSMFNSAGAVSAPAILASPENGVSVPPHGTYRVFLIFAEVDFSNCPQGKNENANDWLIKQLPGYKDQLFDHTLSSEPPASVATDYYYQMSLGNFIVLGDYYPEIVTITPTVDAAGNCPNRILHTGVIEAINDMHEPGGVKDGQPITTEHNRPGGGKYTLADFDLWESSDRYEAKPNNADGLVDMALVIWRNYNQNGNQWRQCLDPGFDPDTMPWSSCANQTLRQTLNFASGSITTWDSAQSLGAMTGFNNLGQFTGSGLNGLSSIMLHEFNHGIIGGNNWHLGSGADRHTVHAPQGSYGFMAEAATVSYVANAWDRNQFGWLHPLKTHSISALDENGIAEVPTDISIVSHPLGTTFMLRDFMNTNDAVRIKLPHINWAVLGDVKNQYLWLENRQMQSRRFDGTEFDFSRLFDINKPLETNTCFQRWAPGLHAYIQIGKDTKDVDVDGDIDAADLNSGTWVPEHPASLGSFLFPLTAEGNYDFFYRLDLVEDYDPNNSFACQWNNVSVPIERERSIPNPFTGYSDVFISLDSGDFLSNPRPDSTLIPLSDGELFSNDLKLVISEFFDGQIQRSLAQWGDTADVFRPGTGRTKLSVGTNPAPVPVYTHISQDAYSGPNRAFVSDIPLPTHETPGSYENRTIWLNGLSVEILDQSLVDEGNLGYAYRVQIRWDDHRIDNDVRWTGTIVLQNDVADPLNRQNRIVLGSGKTLFLDRGLSPTQDVANTDVEDVFVPVGDSAVYPDRLPAFEQGRLFTQPTRFTVRSGTKLHLERDAVIRVLNGSELIVEPGAEVQLEPGAEIATGLGGGTIDLQGVSRAFGDLNMDDCVDRSDMLMLLADVRNRAEHNPFYDLNEDGQVNIADARMLVTFFYNPRGAACFE